MSKTAEACADLCNFVSSTGNISKHLRIVHDYAVHTSTGEGLPAEICSSLSMIGQFMEYVELLEQPEQKGGKHV